MFDAGLITKATLLSEADVLVDFFSHAFAADEVYDGPVLIVEPEHVTAQLVQFLAG